MEEQKAVEVSLLQPHHIAIIQRSFLTVRSTLLANFLAPYHKLLLMSPLLCRKIISDALVEKLLDHLSHPDIIVHLNALKILLQAVKNGYSSFSKVILRNHILPLMDSSSPVLIREIVSQLVKYLSL